MAIKIQKKISSVKFKKSYIERNGDDINEIANGAMKVAFFVGSVAAMLTGKGTLGRVGVVGLKTKDKIKCVKSKKEVQDIENNFEALKNISLSIIFNN